MANYNTFILIDTKSRKIILTTSSARKVKKEFIKGHRVDVWNSNRLIHKIYSKNINDLNKYVSAEKEFIANKQRKAEMRNKKRKAKLAMQNNKICEFRRSL